MSEINTHDDALPDEAVLPPPVPEEAGAEDPLAWEEVAAGRYMPRRIRGSCRGRVLG
jgi:hypothetical protein